MLRNRKNSPFKFRRQHPIGPYIADFACPEAKLVIEIDGYWHKTRERADAFRSDRLRDLGYEVVRFETADGGGDVGPLVEAIIHAVRERLASRS
jgi:very-short-patch-repair endonuclease